MSSTLRNVIQIGRREFYSVAFNPVVIVLLALSLIHVYINAAFGRVMLDSLSQVLPMDDMFILGYGQVYGTTMVIFAIVAGFLGVLSVSEERGGSLKVLLCKPVYRLDVILGKILGISTFAFAFIVITQLLTGLLLVVYYREPISANDYILRLIAFISTSFLESVLIAGLGMLAGIVLKNILVATSAIAIYIFSDFIGGWINFFPVTVNRLLNGILVPADNVILFRNSVPFSTWFSLAMPNIVLMALIIIVVILVDCMIFSRHDETE